MVKKCFLVLLLLLSMVMPQIAVLASYDIDITEVESLELSSGQITGKKAEYYYKIPSSWMGKIKAERENLDSGSLLEKINFYYIPENKVFKPAFLMSLYVYDKKDGTAAQGTRKLLETENYIFGLYSTFTNIFDGKKDKEQFQSLISDASDNQFIKNCIILAGGNYVLPEYTVTVNGILQEGSKSVKKNGVICMPLRSICEALGYRVGWSEEERAILILSGSFNYYVYLDNNTFDAYVENGTTYLSSAFFVQILKTTVEIDERCNVYVRK